MSLKINFKLRGIESNIWKYFLYILTLRRHYITILSIYFMTFPDSTIRMIGIYTMIGNLAAFLLEIPSGYFADRFGHKNTLVLAKILMILSTASFLFFQNLIGFIFGSIFLSVSFAFSSGTMSAFMHETLCSLKREKDFSEVVGKIRGNVSLISMFLIILLPFTTQYGIEVPLMINLIFDFFGLIISLSFVNPRNFKKANGAKIKSIISIFKESWSLGFMPFVIFFSAISGFMVDTFKYIYLELLGYPVIYVGFVMGLSRLVWFIVGRYSYLIEKYFTMRQHMIFEMIFFPFYFFLIGFIQNPYSVAALIILGVGYLWGRSQVIESYTLKYFIPDKNYKATIISIKNQVSLFFQFLLPFIFGMIAEYSFRAGYYFLSGSLFLILIISFIFICKNILIGKWNV